MFLHSGYGSRSQTDLTVVNADGKLRWAGMTRYRILRFLGAFLLLGAGALAFIGWVSTAPALGPRSGRLQPCPASPNCVCSQDPAGPSEISAFACGKGTTAVSELARLKVIVLAQSRMRLLEERPGYLRFEATSALFRYKDDLEFLADEAAHVLQVRSASRVGHSDLGTNRRRVETLRQKFTAAVPTGHP